MNNKHYSTFKASTGRDFKIWQQKAIKILLLREELMIRR